jgi:hypothetical protein
MLLEGSMGGQNLPYGFVSECVFGFEPRDSSSSMTWFCMQLGSTSDVEHHVFSQTEGLATGCQDGMSRQHAASSMFAWLIICLFQLIFSVRTIFFSYTKSANSVFQPTYQPSRTGPSTPASHIPPSTANPRPCPA